MNHNEFNCYVENYILELNKSNDNRKVRFFASYIKRYSQENNCDILDLFRTLDANFLLDSILAYITEMAPTQNVATEYRRIIMKFCNTICEKYELENVFLNNMPQQIDFNNFSSGLFSELRKTESRNCLPFEELERLEAKIDEYLSMENLNEEVIKSIETPYRKPNYYGKLVSAIALKLVKYFGLSNDVIAKLEITDLNVKDRKLAVNGFDLYLNDDIISYFKLYLDYRKSVVSKTNSKAVELFISNKGKAYLNNKNHAENGQLFILLDEVFNSYSTTGLQYRAIVDLVSRGANIELLHQLTGTDAKTIAEICVGNKEEFETIFRCSYVATKKFSKGQFKCPNCKEMIEATSEKAVLLKYPNDNTLYLYCRECGEKEKAKFGGTPNE